MLGKIINSWWVNINWIIKENNSKIESMLVIILNLAPIIFKKNWGLRSIDCKIKIPNHYLY
jgi:hypothetical protein